jgi:hypothetical protein
MSTPVSPDPSHVNPSVTPSPAEPSQPSMTGSFQFQPMTFLGMSFDADQTKKLWDCILKKVSDQINKDNEKAKKAIRNFGKGPGDPGYED